MEKETHFNKMSETFRKALNAKEDLNPRNMLETSRKTLNGKENKLGDIQNKHWISMLSKLINILQTSRKALDERGTNSKASRKSLDRVVNQTQRYIEDIKKNVG